MRGLAAVSMRHYCWRLQQPSSLGPRRWKHGVRSALNAFSIFERTGATREGEVVWRLKTSSVGQDQLGAGEVREGEGFGRSKAGASSISEVEELLLLLLRLAGPLTDRWFDSSPS